MNKGSAGKTKYAVDWIRGARDHLLATDLLAAAPIGPGSQRLDFFFHAATQCPGQWLPAEACERLGDHEQIVATLRILEADSTHKSCFVVDNRSSIAKRINDLAEEGIISASSYENGRTTMVTTNEYGIWEYVIWGTKALGLALYPGVHWYIVYVKADLKHFPAATANHTMSLWLHRTRLGIYEVSFSMDGKVLGSVGARERSH